MATVRTVDFLPEIFQTDANRQFLAATLDQLVQEPRFKKTQGFIGRTVGAGVNPNDTYVQEPNKTRQDYQLEPGVVSLVPDTDTVKNVLTYPGLNDGIALQSGVNTRPDLLYASEYYSWDPFIDFDSFVNFSQYFWLPNGPDVVSVSATEIPTEATYAVTRDNGVYTFSTLSGTNPTIELLRGGSYTFQVAQNNKETVNYRVRNVNTSAYVIDSVSNPTLTLARGNTYVFNLALDGIYPFWIKTQPITGTGDAYNAGVTRNGSAVGLVTFTVPQDAPDVLYYSAENQTSMHGTINVVSSAPGTGPGFWIQAAPGISGQLPTTPNISSRDVMGVNNNGEDVGFVTFNVPSKTAQAFYYNLASIGTVDLISTLNFDQVNNQSVTQFLAQHGGIDGIAYLNGLTLIFTNPETDAELGGWQRTSLYDPLDPGTGNQALPGSYDSLPYSQTTDIPLQDRYQIWQISYVNSGGQDYMVLNQVGTVTALQKFTIAYGSTYSNTQWYKDANGLFQRIPLLSAVQDTLWYQDGTDPEIFGRIKLIDPVESTTIFIDEILGQKTYTSPNGVKFSNGLKVKFVGDVVPLSYKSGVTTISYTATAAGTNYITSVDSSKLYVDQEIIFTAPTLGGLEPNISYYVRSISADNTKFTLSSVPGGAVVELQAGTGTARQATIISDRQYYVSGVGSAIELLPTQNFIVPESYAQDNDPNSLTVEPSGIDYLTISRASKDLNAWTRSNRWFHLDIINATAQYNDTTPILDNQSRAKRPIIQFRPGLRLWNMGTQGKTPVDIIDFEESDALSNIQGSTAYSVDGYTFVEGTRVIFAADQDADVRNKIYLVSFVTPDAVPPLIAQPVINLTLATDGETLTDQCTVVLSGTTSQGKTYWFNGTNWLLAQQKNAVQQAPLYNVYDPDGVSFGSATKYPSTTFSGSKLFSYALGDTTLLDPILQFPLQYLNINNVGDIVFENNLYKDTFLYVTDNASTTKSISAGHVLEYQTRSQSTKLLGWQTAVVESQLYQQFKFTYQDDIIKLDIPVRSQTSIDVPVVKVYVGGIFQEPTTYTFLISGDTTEITLQNTFDLGQVVEVLALSHQVSATAFFQVPINLESNPLNTNSNTFTLGTVRTHYQSICENLPGLLGPVAGANNVRDLGNVVPYGQIILQQSAPITLAGYFVRNQEYNIFTSLIYNSQEYIKYKAQILDAVLTQNIGFNTVAQVLDQAVQDVTLGKIDSQPFYWSDMLPSGITTASTLYTVSFITTNVFDTVQVYDYESANYFGLCVYKNNVLLTRGIDYVVATDGPRITILSNLAIGDEILVNEYARTYGSFVPNTPTKLGLYPAYVPKIIVEKTSTGSQAFVRGHDGSLTPVFADIRDQVLLEFETRIYNNLKLDNNPVPLTVDEVLPGQFRNTGYTWSECNNILAQDFLSYCGWNKLNYQTQNYIANNEFTWNYSSAQNRLDNQSLKGAWRGIYRYTYDTQQPQLTPWEMLGLSVEPVWWQQRYGPAPYTRDNLVLWDDLESGYVADTVAPYYVPAFARPGLTDILPTGTEGELLPPFQAVMGSFDENQLQKSWAVGDGGPVEASWWNSSSYPFAVMRLLAVTKPAKFFALFADRDRYKFNEEYQQYLYDDRYRLDANGIQVYGNGISKASYINWIVDYNRLSGQDSTQNLTNDLASLDVRLCYRMASFSDKQYIKIFTEKSSPNSVNTTLLIPDNSFDLLLYKNQPFGRAVYSSVTIQKTESGGYSVAGYSTVQPYFNVVVSKATGKLQTYTNSGVTIRVPTFYTNQVAQVPYGFVFSSLTSVADFLLSYGRYLETQGFSFTNMANGYVLNWSRMVNEFLYWSQQGWSTDAIINLNPLADGLTVIKANAIVDQIQTQTVQSNLLDQNSQNFATRNLNIVRLDNLFKCQPLNDQSISFADLTFTSYEHIIVLKNQSEFGDLIYDPATGARQNRLTLVAVNTTDWNGSVNAPGFILNQDNVQEWSAQKTYSKGEIVKYKNVYWSALKIVQPSINFNFNDWIQSDYEQIELGLLPNLSNKANQLSNSYNVNVANIERDNDLLSYGLIGFRPRQYMAALNLDDVSQVNVYKQFLGSKGTILSSELFKGANFAKESADYDIYENWAVQRAVYGANANRSFFELRLNRGLLNANPSIVQVTIPQQISTADQTVLLSDIWRQSYKITSPDILPVTTELPTDIGLPSAGYVDLDEVDITVFDLVDINSLNENIDLIQVGTTIWAAKVNDYDWNIYRAKNVPGTLDHVCDNLDGSSRAIFSAQHNLAVGDTLIVKFFAPEVDGVYTVLSVPNLNTVNIAFQFTGDTTVLNGTGLGFTIETQRVSQASDIVDLDYANQIRTGARVWVDDNGAGSWTVLEKKEAFTERAELAPKILDATERFGVSVAQARNRLATLVGSPRYGFGTGTTKGAVYLYVKNFDATYTPVSPLGNDEDAILTLDITGVRGYGNAVDFGDQTWAVAGASASLGPAGQSNNGYAAVIYRDPVLGQPGVIPYAQWQLLTQPTTTPSTTPGAGEFGYSVAMSSDERWMYIGAPGLNQVHAYGKVDYQNQFVRSRGDGATASYVIDSVIQIDTATQLKVTLDGTVQSLGTDYTVSGDFSTVTFNTAPDLDVLIDIQRLYVKQLDAETYFDVSQTSTSGSGVGAKFTIVRIRGQIGQPGSTVGTVGVTTPGSGYSIGNTITIAGSSFGGTNNAVLTIISVDASGGVVSFSIAYTPPALATTFSLNEYFFTARDIYSFSVYVDDVLYRPNIDYTFNTSTRDLTFVTVPASGTTILVNAQGYFTFVSSITVAGLDAGARFGQTLSCSTDGRQLLVGAPYQTVNSQIEAGAVYVIDRNIQKFVKNNDSTQSYVVLGTPVAPISVLVNGEFLINQDNSVIGGVGTFTVNSNIVTINDPLDVGDIIEIETNQFKLVQTVSQNIVANFSNFGSAVDLCLNNCSLYTGAPNSSQQIFKGGLVERNVNQSRVYGTITSTVANPVLTAGQTLRVNNIDVEIPATNPTVQGLADAINGIPVGIQSGVPNVVASVSQGLLTIAVKNSSAAPANNKVQVSPGTVGSAFTTLGFKTFVWTQNIESPNPVSFAKFGASVSIDSSAVNLVVGAPEGSLYLATVFDDGETVFDALSTEFFDTVTQSGAVYTYDYLNSADESALNPGKFVFGLQLGSIDVQSYDLFGTAVNYTSGILAVGAPSTDFGDSSLSNYGSVFVYENALRAAAWQPIRVQTPVVDIRLLNSAFLYDKITSTTTEFLDFIDPLQGKILGAARQNIDYIGAVDPAAYNSGPRGIRGNTWGAEHLGQIWWDISTVRFIDPNQDNIVYAARRWSQVFPGSVIDVYQWIESNVPPGSYTGPGTPLDQLSYTVNSSLDNQGTILTTYYFWVKGLSTIPSNASKTLPITTIASYIENPKSSGIPYLAAINASTVALFNTTNLVEAQDTILHIEYDRELTESNVHVEYELIAQGRDDGFLSDNLYKKLQDSFCGVDSFGNIVPDLNLGPAERYGVQFRPRQSMFVDRFAALKNYLTRANAVLRQYPITETRVFNLLNSSEPQPSTTSGLWNAKVANLEILSYQNIYAVPLGYRYLVESDSSNRGLWTIYTVQSSQTQLGQRLLVLTRVQNYNTPDYWTFIDWYRPGYNSSIRPVTEVVNFAALSGLEVDIGSSVKVTANSQGKFEIYLRTDLGWERVGLQNGTIEFSAELWDYALGRFGFDIEVFDAQYYDQEPVIETRKIIQAINQELFIDDLAIERNRALMLMFDFVLSEFAAPEWLVKTSLIDVDHRIRELVPFQNYVRDNQEFVSDYIKEVKPYHVQIREFNLTYSGNDIFQGDVNDFDLPAYFNTGLEIPAYTSPVLLPYELSTAFNSSLTTLSDTPPSSTLWTNFPYNQWYQNYLLSIKTIEIISGGSGYNDVPLVTIVGDADEPGQAEAVINSLGSVVSIVITSPGKGYRATPQIVFSGGNGSGARAYAVMTGAGQAQNYNSAIIPTSRFDYNLARTFRTTIKYDRYQYNSVIADWNPNSTYQNGDLVRYLDKVWEANSTDSTAVVGPTFDLENWLLVDPGTYTYPGQMVATGLSGVDRTRGLYVPGVNSPGLELPLLIDGIDYPGVKVYGDYFTRLESSLDADYQSAFTDTTLGNTVTSVNVVGGQFVDQYEGHAPEELVNGAEFDTLDLRVYTRPGSDWDGNGHGFQIGSIRYTYEPAVITAYSWQGVVDHPVQVLVSNVTTGLDLYLDIDFTIDWDDQTVTILNNVSVDDIFNISVYELGGGSQLYRANYLGAEVGNSVIIPVNSAEIYEIGLFVNGQSVGVAGFAPYIDSVTWSITTAYQRLTVVSNLGLYYRAIQAVPVGVDLADTNYWMQFVPTLLSEVTFVSTYGANDGIALVAFGYTTPLQYTWSTPQCEVFVVDATTITTKTFVLANSIQGTNPANIVVTKNGLRLQPAEGIEWFGDDSSVSFGLPQRGGYSQSIINAVTDIQVWVDNVLQTQSFGSFTGEYSVTNWDGSNTPGRQVVFVTPPAAGSRILISVNTQSDYDVVSNTVEIISSINLGDRICVTTWNDTAQQNLLTLVFKGPITTGITISEPYDSTDFDLATVTGDPGSFDYSVGSVISSNNFDLERNDVDAGRLWVTLDGYRLFEGVDYTVQGQNLILASGTIGAAQILAVTQLTNSQVPEAMAFRIFQDMRGVQATYRITDASTTSLSQPLLPTDDIIYVTNAAALSQPDLSLGIMGVISINGERIMYRERSVIDNTVSSLLRGTAGTGATTHDVDSVVYDFGRGNLLPEQFQDYVVKDTAYGDGSTTVFYAPNIVVADFLDSSSANPAVQVYVGGIRQFAYSDTTAQSQYRWFITDWDPVAVDFVVDNTAIPPLVPPPAGIEVTILVRRGHTWYQQGVGTASDGVALQDTNTDAARFLRGL